MQDHQLCKQVQALQVSCHLHPPLQSTAVKTETRTLHADSEKREHKTMTGCRARSTSLWVHRNLFWQLPIDGNLYGSGMWHATTASSKPSFRPPLRVGDTIVRRGNAGWTTSKSGHPCLCQNCSLGRPAEKSGRGSWLNHPSCPPDNQSAKGLNWMQHVKAWQPTLMFTA